jgi:hypothetical protein
MSNADAPRVSDERLREARAEVREWLDCSQVTIDLSKRLPSLRGVLEAVVAGLDELLALRTPAQAAGVTVGEPELDAAVVAYAAACGMTPATEGWKNNLKQYMRPLLRSQPPAAQVGESCGGPLTDLGEVLECNNMAAADLHPMVRALNACVVTVQYGYDSALKEVSDEIRRRPIPAAAQVCERCFGFKRVTDPNNPLTAMTCPDCSSRDVAPTNITPGDIAALDAAIETCVEANLNDVQTSQLRALLCKLKAGSV